jgi:hypothetical protein
MPRFHPDQCESTDIDRETDPEYLFRVFGIEFDDVSDVRSDRIGLARLRVLGRQVASAAACFAFALVVTALLYPRIPDVTDVIVSVGPLKVFVGSEVDALVISLAFSSGRAMQERRPRFVSSRCSLWRSP